MSLLHLVPGSGSLVRIHERGHAGLAHGQVHGYSIPALVIAQAKNVTVEYSQAVRNELRQWRCG